MNAYGTGVGDTFTFRVTDSFGASADTTFIAKMNEAPTLTADTGAVSENATLSVSAEQEYWRTIGMQQMLILAL